MDNRKNIVKGIVVATALSYVSSDSMASAIESYKITNIEDNRIDGNIKKFFAKVVKPMENLISEPKKAIKVNRNIVEGKVLEIILNDGQFVQDLSGNPDGYETVRVTTNGDKKLVQTDYNNLRLSGIPKVDLSNAYSDSIPWGAFQNITHLTEIKFPKGLTKIDGYAFQNCSGLEGNLVIPETVVELGDCSFQNCSGLTGDLVIPNSVTSIRSYAFSGCTGFNGKLTIGNSVEYIGDSAFLKCSGLTGNLTIPNSVTFMGNTVFKECTSFTGDLIIPNSLTSVGKNAFANCTGFNGRLIIPNTITKIDAYAFEKCTGFKGNLVIPDSVTIIENNAFAGCNGFDGELVIGNSVETIGGSTFDNCSKLTGNLVIPNSVTSIGGSAFYNCRGFIGDLTIPDTVINIGSGAFQGCNGFNGKLTIGNSVEYIGERAFASCSNLTGDLIIPNSVKNIDSRAFAACTGLNGKLVISNSLTSIKNHTFYNCTSLTGRLIIPDSVVEIGDYAFSSCVKLTGELIIPNSVTTINNYSFENCNGLTGDVAIPDSITSIGTGAFNRCYNIGKILIKIDSSNIDTNYKESIIANLPDTIQTVIDVSYDFSTTGTWLESTNKLVAVPVIKNIVNGVESDLINYKGDSVSLYIPSLYKESNINVLKDGKKYNLPSKNINNKYIFTEAGAYQVTVTTDLGNTSVINFEVEDPRLKLAEEAVSKAEISKGLIDISDARDLVNNLPECSTKDLLQDRLDAIFPNITSDIKSASANLDIYIKSENMLSLSLDTNSVTFEGYSGVEPIEKLNAINITISSSLPYELNAYMPTEISNADRSKEMSLGLFNIKEGSESTYKQFENNMDKVILKENCLSGNNIKHSIDLKLDNNDAYIADVYKTVIKFEAEQI